MFLSNLKQQEKEIFIALANEVIKADGVIQESEKQIMAEYVKEMSIDNLTPPDIDDLDKMIQELASISSNQNKRIIFVELLALAFVDGEFAIEEKQIVNKVASAFGFNDAIIERVVNLQDAYTSAYMSIVEFVNEGKK